MLKDIAFCHLLANWEINMVRKLMVTVTKAGADAGKTASKRVVWKIAKATGDLIRNKIASKTTSLCKTESKEKEDETNKRLEIYISAEKFERITDDLRLFQIPYKNEIPKNYKPTIYNI